MEVKRKEKRCGEADLKRETLNQVAMCGEETVALSHQELVRKGKEHSLMWVM